jgi:quercetin dioxygenase-like cupin family protein
LGDRAKVLGWRDDIAALMRWSSIIVTKGGPTTLAEALSQARPVLISHALPGQERGNITVVRRSGAGRYTPQVGDLVRAVAGHHRERPKAETTQAEWWGSASKRVVEHILAAHARSNSTLRPLASTDEQATLGGGVIYNPISGERIIIRENGAQNGGALMTFDHFMPPGGHVPARHVHPIQEERFTVVEGQMRFRLGRRTSIIANPGDTVVVPAGTAHWFGNAGTGISHAFVEVRPALRMAELFETAASMDPARQFLGLQVPRLTDLALFMMEFRRELAVPDVPAFLVRALLAPLAWLGRRRGHTVRPESGG